MAPYLLVEEQLYRASHMRILLHSQGLQSTRLRTLKCSRAGRAKFHVRSHEAVLGNRLELGIFEYICLPSLKLLIN